MNFIEYILIMIYLINNLEYGIVVDFVDLQEIKEKYFGEVLSICIGNFVSKYIIIGVCFVEFILDVFLLKFFELNFC